MNLDTMTLAPGNTRPEPETPIEQAAQQLCDHITNIITAEHTNNTRDTHEAATRATNAEREYTRLCRTYEELLTENEATLKELADVRTQLDAALRELEQLRTTHSSAPGAGTLTAAPADTPTSSALPTTGTEQPE